MITCKECHREFETLDSLRRHRSQTHAIGAAQTYIDYKFGGVPPTCKCGCGINPQFVSIQLGFREYIRGHAARVNNNWGNNPVALAKSHATQKEMHANGSLTIWNKGLTMDDERVRDNVLKVTSNPERNKKISEKLTGLKRTDAQKAQFSDAANIRWSNPDERNKQRFRRITYFKNRQFNLKNKLEMRFEKFLVDLNLKFECQYPLSGYLFDFYLNDYNILIEVDGDFYHCNPNSKYPKPIYEIQRCVTTNDSIKNTLAIDTGIKLLRFWESDINNNPENVIIRLKEAIYS